MDGKMVQECQNCNSAISNLAKFCQTCGVKVTDILCCSACSSQLKADYKFCPGCGSSCQKKHRASSSSTVDHAVGPSDVRFEALKEKLTQIRDRRLGKGPHPKQSTSRDYQEPGPSHKSTYILVCGIKTYRRGEWIQVKGKSSPYNHSAIKKVFEKTANYQQVLQALKMEFGCDDNDVESVLLDMNNESMDNQDDFTILEYVKRHKKYAGATRIYIGVRESLETGPSKSEGDDYTSECSKTERDDQASKGPKSERDDKDDQASKGPKSERDDKDDQASKGPKSERDDKDDQASKGPKSERDDKDDQASKGPKSERDDKDDQASKGPKSERDDKDDQASKSSEDAHCSAMSSEETRDDYFRKVLDFVREEQLEEQQRNMDEGTPFDTDTRIYCPVYAVNPKVILFQEVKEKKYKKITNMYGQFLCIPHKDMEEFHIFCKTVNEKQLFVVDPPLLYYLHYVHASDSPNVHVSETASEEVWELPASIAEDFIQWKSSIASIC